MSYSAELSAPLCNVEGKWEERDVTLIFSVKLLVVVLASPIITIC